MALCRYPREEHYCDTAVPFWPAHRGRGWPHPMRKLYCCPFHAEMAAQRWGIGRPENEMEINATHVSTAAVHAASLEANHATQ